jgi:hypothetical protein
MPLQDKRFLFSNQKLSMLFSNLVKDYNLMLYAMLMIPVNLMTFFILLLKMGRIEM